jgi:alginate O-acetyltransferase complex protein AlgJ
MRFGRRALVVRLAAAPLPTAALAQDGSGVRAGKDGWLFASWDVPSRAVAQAQLKAIADQVAEAVAAIRSARIEVALALIPNKSRIHVARTPEGRMTPEVERRYEYLLSELRRGGTLAVDLATPLQRTLAQRPDENLFFRTDTHWTPRGAEVAATEVARQVQERFRLPASPRPGVRLGGYTTQTLGVGDLGRLLPPPERSRIQPEEYRVRDLPANAAGALLDDAGGDVAVVGSSYMDPRFRYTDVLSNQLNRPLQVTWRVNNVGPWGTLLEYLRSDSFRRERPRVLIWHLLEIDLGIALSASNWGRHAMTPQAFMAGLRSGLGA